jgi:hypothetical protein
MLAQSVMWRGKHIAAKSWQRKWNKEHWLKHLFGRMLKHSMAENGVEKFISSLGDIRVNLSPLPEKDLQKKTQDIYGQSSQELLEKSNLQSVSLKMSEDIYDLDLNLSQMTYEKWVIKLRQVCLQRAKSVLLINESDFSYWPTTTSSDATTGEIISPKDKFVRTSQGAYRKINPAGESRSLGLGRMARIWPTVMKSSANGHSMVEIQKGNKKRRLANEVIMWPTLRAQDPAKTSKGYGKSTTEVAKSQNWRTPNASDIEGGIMEWRDGKAGKLKLRDHSVHIAKKISCQSGHQSQKTLEVGIESQLTLNPLFCEHLMGWPIGWTGLEPVEMELCRWFVLMHGELSRLECISKKLKEENDVKTNKNAGSQCNRQGDFLF